MSSDYDFTGINSAPDGAGADIDHLASYPQAPNDPDVNSLGALNNDMDAASKAVAAECSSCRSAQGGGINTDNQIDEIAKQCPAGTNSDDFDPGYTEELHACRYDSPREWKESDNTGPVPKDDDYPRMMGR